MAPRRFIGGAFAANKNDGKAVDTKMVQRQEVEEFARDFAAIGQTIGEDFTEALLDCKEPIAENIEDNFQQSQTAGGSPWPPRKDPAPTHPLLILSGDLKAAAIYGNVDRIEGGRELVFGVSKDTIPYAAVHQYGWPEQNIAQREYMGVSEITVDKCAEIVLDSKYAEVVA